MNCLFLQWILDDGHRRVNGRGSLTANSFFKTKKNKLRGDREGEGEEGEEPVEKKYSLPNGDWEDNNKPVRAHRDEGRMSAVRRPPDPWDS